MKVVLCGSPQPRITPTFLTVVLEDKVMPSTVPISSDRLVSYHMQRDCHRLQKKILKKREIEIWKKWEKFSTPETLFVVLYSSPHKTLFQSWNWVHTGQMWHIFLCDLIIRLLVQHSSTTSVFHYKGTERWARMGLSWRGSHGSLLCLDEGSDSLHPSSCRILLMLQWR